MQGAMAAAITAPHALLVGSVIGMITLVIVTSTVRGVATYES
jgi:hypothetical protein